MKKIALAVVAVALAGGAALAYAKARPAVTICPDTPDCPNIICPETGEECCLRDCPLR